MTDKKGTAPKQLPWQLEELRDGLAKAAMQGLLTNHYMIDNIEESSFEWVAKNAYRMADAMLRAREK